MEKYTEVKHGKETGIGYELIITKKGCKVWRLNGRAHRIDGHAYEELDGFKSWYLNGKLLYKDWFLKNPEKIKKMKAWELFEPEELVGLKHEINKT